MEYIVCLIVVTEQKRYVLEVAYHVVALATGVEQRQ